MRHASNGLAASPRHEAMLGVNEAEITCHMNGQIARILVVDDEFSVRDSLYNWFRKDGHEVMAAENAHEALKALQDHAFDVALLDIKMPGMDGMELQEHIHRIDPQIAVIMITAFASVDTAVRALKQGAFDYVTKPIDPDELSHLVLRALEQRRLREENAQLRETIDDLIAVDEIVGDSPSMRKVMELVMHVAQDRCHGPHSGGKRHR